MYARSLSSAVLLASGLLLAGMEPISGCGQGVATCNSVCAGAVSCASACSAQEAACVSAGYAGDFQAYLTCIGNVGTSTALPDNAQVSFTAPAPCAAEEAALASECGSGSGSGTGSGTSSSPAPACAVLADCCAGLPPPSSESCNGVADQGDESACTADLIDLEDECTGGGGGSGNSCAPPCESIGSECACP